MARKLRVQYPGALYHLMNRGDRREPIFKDDDDRWRFLETLGHVCGKAGYGIRAWSVTVIQTCALPISPKANLVGGMKWFLGTYTSRFNRRHKLRSEERRVGKECRSRWATDHYKKRTDLRLRASQSEASQSSPTGNSAPGTYDEHLSSAF